MAILPSLIIVLALVLYVGLILNTGRERERCGIKAPAVTGAPAFERAFRIQQNTLEQLVLFVPALWLFSLFVSPAWGTLLGIVWLVARIAYSILYTGNPERRRIPFLISLLAALILLVGAFAGILAMLTRTGLA